MFTHPRRVNDLEDTATPVLAAPPVWEYPFLLIKSVRVVSRILVLDPCVF